MAGITAKRHNAYRVKRRTGVAFRYDRPATIKPANALPLALAA